MRKLLSILAVLCAVLGSANAAIAADIKASGFFDFGFGLYGGTNFTKHDNEENFDAGQYFRTQLEIDASESLKGVAIFEVGVTYWGNGGGATWGSGGNGAGRGAGGAMGADGVSVEIMDLYIDWLVPNTDALVRMGIQYFNLPNAVWRGDYMNGNVVVADDAPGIVIEYPFNENIGATVGWFRPWDPYVNGGFNSNSNLTSYYNSDEIDAFFLTLPINMQDSFNITPYFMYASIGEVDTDLDANGLHTNTGTISHYLSSNGSLGGNGNAWWSGLAFTLNHFSPFNAYLDLIYGSYSASDVGPYYGTNNSDPDRYGWVAIGKLEYKLDYFTPNIFGWYGSGTDSFENDGLDGMMPSFSPFFGMTSFGFASDRHDTLTRQGIVGYDPFGKWGIGGGLDDIKVIDDLTSYFRVLYMRGTNDTNGLDTAFWDYGIFDEGDQMVEVDLDSVYNIYENLELHVELGYINIQLDNEPDGFEENAWKAYTGFRYYF